VVCRRHTAQRQQGRGGEDLRQGAGLERVGERARARAAVPLARGKGQHLAGPGIEHHDVPRVRIHASQRVVQGALRDLLQLRVQRQHDVEPGHGRGDHARRRLVFASRAVLQHYRRTRPAGQQAVEGPLESGGAQTVVSQAADGRASDGGIGIEAVGHRFEMHPPHTPERLYFECAVGPREVGVAPAQGLLPGRCRKPEPAADERAVRDRVAELVGGDAHMVGLLRDGERRAVAVIQGAAPRR